MALELRNGKMQAKASQTAIAKLSRRVMWDYNKVVDGCVRQLLAAKCERSGIEIRRDPTHDTQETIIAYKGTPVFHIHTVISKNSVQIVAEPILK